MNNGADHFKVRQFVGPCVVGDEKTKKPRRYKLFQGYLRGLFYVRFFNIPRAILFSSSFFCSIFCLSCKIESSWIITFVCPTVIDFRIIIHTSIEGMRKMSFFACPDLFYFDSFLLLYLKKTKGRHEKYAIPVVYHHILLERVLFPLGSVGKLAGQFKAKFLNGFFNF